MESAIDDLDPQCIAMQRALAERAALLEYPSSFNFADVLELEDSTKSTASECFLALLASWREKASEIRQNGSVAQFRDAAQTYQKTVAANNKQKWSGWTSDLETQFLIADAQIESVKHVPDYKAPIATYKRKCEEFYSANQVVPTKTEAIEQIQQLSKDLGKIRNSISFDLPPKILRFYELLDRDGLYPLSRLDSDIYDWLKDHDGLKDLTIRRRGNTPF
jgi:hypothetical protein